jgi:enamine deaminase RidA (YjgF/YER057c/UK114 family)
MTFNIEDRLKELGIVLPEAPKPVAAYVPVLKSGNLVVVSGQLPMRGKEVAFTGKVGLHLDEATAAQAARLAAINCLAQLKACLGTLDHVTRILRVEGFVQSAPGFTFQPLVVNGTSELLVEAFGDIGRHTRIAVGVSELPLNACVEIALWAEAAE